MILDSINIIESSPNYNHVFTNVLKAERLLLQNLEIGEVVYQTDDEIGLYVYSGNNAWSKIDEIYIKEYSNVSSFPTTGKKEIIYVAKDVITPYYWDGSAYVSLIKKSIDDLKDNVDAAGNTLAKLYGLISNKIEKNTDIIAATGIKITYDTKGLIKSSAALEASDIPNLDASKITSGNIDVNRLPSNIVTTDANGKLPSTLTPSVTLVDTKTPSNTASMLADTTSPTGTVSIVTNDPDPTKNGSYVKNASGEWVKLSVPTDPVTFINGKNGVIAKILAEDIGGVFENDANKTLLSSKLPLFTGDVESTTSDRTKLSLKTNVSLLEGEYYYNVKVNNKGLVVSGKIGESYTKTEADTTFLKLSVSGNRNAAEGFVGLNTNTKIDSKYLPAITLNTIYTVSTIAQRDALTVKTGDTVIVTSELKTYIVSAISPTVWTELLNPTGSVTSVNGNTGPVTIDFSNLPGTLSLDKLPKYTNGDVFTNVSNELELKTISGLTSGTYSKVTVNSKGLVTASATLEASDIPNLSWNKITTDKPNFAILDLDNKLPYANLNRDVIEVSTLPASGEINKVYVNTSDNSLHRYSATGFVRIGGSDTIQASALPTFIGDVTLNTTDSSLNIQKIKGLEIDTLYSGTITPPLNSFLTFNETKLVWSKLSDFNVITTNAEGKIDSTIIPKSFDLNSSRITTINGKTVSYKDDNAALQSLTSSDTINTIALTKDSKQLQIISASELNTNIVLPNAKSLLLGGIQFIIKNVGYTTLTIVDYETNWICNVLPNATVSLALADNSTFKGTWIDVLGKPSKINGLQFQDPKTIIENCTNVSSTPFNDSILYAYSVANTLYVNTTKMVGDNYAHGTALTIDTITNNNFTIQKLNNTQALLIYKNATGLVAVLLNVSTTITKESPILIDANGNNPSLYTNNGYGILTYDATNIKATVLTVNVNIITVNTVFDTTVIGTTPSITLSKSDSFVVAFKNNSNSLAFLQLNKTNNTLSSDNNLHLFGNVDLFTITNISDNKILCVYNYGTTVNMLYVIIEKHGSDNVLLFGNSQTVNIAKINDLALSRLSNNGALCSILNKNGYISSFEIMCDMVDPSVNNTKTHNTNANTLGISNGFLNYTPFCLYNSNFLEIV